MSKMTKTLDDIVLRCKAASVAIPIGVGLTVLGAPSGLILPGIAVVGITYAGGGQRGQELAGLIFPTLTNPENYSTYCFYLAMGALISMGSLGVPIAKQYYDNFVAHNKKEYTA